MPIPEFHLTVYTYATKRCVHGNISTYEKLKEAINRVAYRPSVRFYLGTIKELERYKLIKEVSGNKRKLKRYLVLPSKEAEDRLSSKGIFPIESLT